MATPSVLQIDDHNPLVFYSPNSSWIRGGAASDFDGTSTHTSTAGASATLTFTGAGVSVWGTIQFLVPDTPSYVVSSYSINKGPTTIFNATETAGYQFQQKLFQSAELNESVPHTIVVTLINNGTFFIDYFLIIPSGGSTTSVTSSLAGSMTVSGADSSATVSAGDRSQSSRVPLGPAVGGALGGLALLIVAVLAVWLCCKRGRKDKNQKNDYVAPVPFVTPADRVSEQQSYSQHPTSNPPTSFSGVIPPSSKTAQLSNPSPRGDSRPLTNSLEPPSYDE